MKLLERRRALMSLLRKSKNLFDIHNVIQCFVTTDASNTNFPTKIQNGIIYSAGRQGISNGGMLFLDVTDIDYITLSFDCDWDTTVSNTQISCIGATKYTEHSKGFIFGLNNYKYLVSTDGSLAIKKGYNIKTFDVIAYKYFGIGFVCNKYSGIQVTNLMANEGKTALPYEPYY